VQGLNRQIRRMVEHFGYEVTKLERVRIMNVSVKGLAVGDWRDLTAQELAGIMKMVEKSSGTEDASGGRRSSKSLGAKADMLGAGETKPVRPRKSGPPSMHNPSGTGWWGPRPDKPAVGTKPKSSGQRPPKSGASRPAKAGPGASRPAKGAAGRAPKSPAGGQRKRR